MRHRIAGAAMAVAWAFLCAFPAQADDYQAKEGITGATLHFAAKLFSGALHPFHIMEGLNGTTPTPLVVDGSSNLKVNCATGCTGGDASAANQTTVQANPGSDATKAVAVQGVTGGKAVKTDGSAVTQPVSLATAPALVASSAIVGKVGIDQTTPGTTNLVSAGQNGTWNLTNISGTVSLPTGAATAAKQPALGTAGSPSADVGTMQGCPTCTPTPVRNAISVPTTTQARPANTTPTVVGGLWANSTTAGSVTVQSFAGPATATCSFRIPLATLSVNATSGMDATAFTVRFYTAAPTYVNGDGGLWKLATNDDKLFGQMSCQMGVNGSTKVAGLCSPITAYPPETKLASGTTVFWDLQTDSVFTPQSAVTATLAPVVEQDAC